MAKSGKIDYDWPETGRLDIQMYGQNSAVLQFTPSEAAIEEAVYKATKSHLMGGSEKAHTNTR